MSTVTLPAVQATLVAEPARRVRLAVIAVLLVVTSAFLIIGGLLWTVPSGDWYAYADIEPVRASWWLNLTLLAATFSVGVPLQAVAAMSLVRRRGSVWVTVGAFLSWIGSALLAVTLGGWAMTYYVATDPGLDAGAATALLDRFATDGHLFGFGQPGSLMISLGTIVVAVGLIRARVVPLWLPILSLVTVLGMFLPAWGVLSLIANVPSAAVAVALGWYAYRRAASPATA
jgi:hypothetical protein